MLNTIHTHWQNNVIIWNNFVSRRNVFVSICVCRNVPYCNCFCAQYVDSCFLISVLLKIIFIYIYMSIYIYILYMSVSWSFILNKDALGYALLIGTLQWRHYERDGVSNHQRIHCLPNHLFGHRSKKASKFRVTVLCEGNSPVTAEFPTQKASNAKNDSIWWRHPVNNLHVHVNWIPVYYLLCTLLMIRENKVYKRKHFTVIALPPTYSGVHKQESSVTYYNMVGVAVAIVISTMHEKSCIDLHNARKFE